MDLAIELIHRITSTEPRTRELAADEVTDVVKSLGAFGPVVANVLVTARLCEDDLAAQEAQLHALDELDEWGFVTDEVRELLSRIDIATVLGSQIEYLEGLLRLA
jgi:hypothetical protein